jgi:hypothetical protein
MTEHDIQNMIRLELSKLGWLTFRFNVGRVKTSDGRYFDTGLPVGFTDLVAFKEGKTIFIEVKKTGGKATQKQKDFIDLMKKNGFKAGIVYSVEDAIKLIESEV